MPVASVGPLPPRLLPVTASHGELVPAWFTDHDRPWLRELLGTAAGFDGRPVDALLRHWRRTLPDPRGGPRSAVARHVLARLLSRAAARPRLVSIRHELFAAAAIRPRDEALAAVAARHGLTAAALAADLFADLPHQRRITWPRPGPEPSWFGLLANRAIAQGLLRWAHAATLRLDGASRAVLRTAWLHGASFALDDDPAMCLRWRPARGGTGRAIAALAPVLPWARQFVLRADCRVGTLHGTFVLATDDPILPGPEPRHYDSGLERAFATAWSALGTSLELRREPRPVCANGRLHFPDFAIVDALGDTWLLEIAGLRDRAALPDKLLLLDADPHYLLCLPRRAVPAGAHHPRIVPFTRTVAARDVLIRVLQRPG